MFIGDLKMIDESVIENNRIENKIAKMDLIANRLICKNTLAGKKNLIKSISKTLQKIYKRHNPRLINIWVYNDIESDTISDKEIKGMFTNNGYCMADIVYSEKYSEGDKIVERICNISPIPSLLKKLLGKKK